jgi:putative sterol carrier protein
VSARAFFEGLQTRVDPTRIAGVDQTFRFEIEGEGVWRVAIHDGAVTVTENGDGAADATIRASSEVFERIVSGEQNPATAYMSGKIKIDGDLGAAMKLQQLF